MVFGKRAVAGITAIVLLSCWLLPTEAFCASFDCRKASTQMEIAVCADPGLSSLDELMAREYRQSIAALSDDGRKLLRQSQRRWLEFVQELCFQNGNGEGATECLRRKYQKRTGQLNQAAVHVGPFLFSRIDYFYLRDDSDFVHPYEGQTSYPRIDGPKSPAAAKWNAIMAPSTEAEGDGWCDGKPGDVDLDYSIASAATNLVSVKVVRWVYCHGAAHGFGGASGRTYLLVPTVRPLEADDLFAPERPWQEFLNEKCFNELKRKAPSAELEQSDIADAVTDPKVWTLSKSGLEITINPSAVLAYGYGETTVIVPWDELRPFLAPGSVVRSLM